MPETHPIVFVVDNDSSDPRCPEQAHPFGGLGCRAFGSAQEFLRWRRSRAPAGIVMDVRLPGTSGTVKVHRSRAIIAVQIRGLTADRAEGIAKCEKD